MPNSYGRRYEHHHELHLPPGPPRAGTYPDERSRREDARSRSRRPRGVGGRIARSAGTPKSSERSVQSLCPERYAERFGYSGTCHRRPQRKP